MFGLNTGRVGVNNGRTVAKIALLPGTIADYFSTPDSAVADITDTLTIIAHVALDDWAPLTQSAIFSKYVTTGDQRSYMLYIRTNGRPELIFSVSGGAVTTPVTANATPTFTNGTAYWIKCVFVASAGTCDFATSDDGVSWTPLGTQVVIAATSIHSGTAPLAVGVAGTGNFWPLAGEVYRVQVYNGVTLAVDFNPNNYVSGTNWTSDTGEVWTINGAATIA